MSILLSLIRWRAWKKLLHKIVQLINHNSMRLQRVEMNMIRHKNEHSRLTESVATSDEKIALLHVLCRNMAVQGKLTRQALYNVLQRQATKRREIAELVLQREQTLIALHKINDAIDVLNEECNALRQQNEKYLLLKSKEKKKRRTRFERIEESEMEETINCKK